MRGVKCEAVKLQWEPPLMSSVSVKLLSKLIHNRAQSKGPLCSESVWFNNFYFLSESPPSGAGAIFKWKNQCGTLQKSAQFESSPLTKLTLLDYVFIVIF